VAFLASLPGVAGWAALVLPGGYLILVMILALVAALSRRSSRRDAAYRVLELIWPRRQSRDELPEEDNDPLVQETERQSGVRGVVVTSTPSCQRWRAVWRGGGRWWAV
jgi:hypothetical protein